MKLQALWPLLLLFVALQACNVKKDRPPNIIFIMSDDHALKAISAYDTSLISTPNIDRLAEEGIRYDNCYCTNAICAPSRAVILTGKYSHVNGVLDNSRPFDGEQQTLPKLLKNAGYQTAMIGKWHLKSEPTGFDHWLVLPGQGDYYNPDFKGSDGLHTFQGYVTDVITQKGIEYLDSIDRERPFFMMLHHKAPHRNWLPAMRHLNRFDGVEFPVPFNLRDDYEGKSAASLEQEMSISRHMSLDYDLKMSDSIIRRKGVDQELFFRIGDGTKRGLKESVFSEKENDIWLNYYADRAREYNSLPNDPQVIDQWKYRQYMEDYLSCISTVDENIGILLDYLKQSGLDENTIVIYTSDQGFFLGEHGWYDKRFMYEEALKMPLIIRMPGQKHERDSHMLTNADFAPTILDLAGLTIPGDMQGESFAASLHGEPMQQWRDAVYYHYFEYPAVHSVKRHYGIRTDRYKLIHFYYDIDTWELYDLQEDPHEMNNLYGIPDYIDLVNDLKSRLSSLQDQYGDTDPQSFLPGIPDTISHIGFNKPYTLDSEPQGRYRGKFRALTDGIVYPEGEAYQFTNSEWCGFRGDDFIIEIDLGKAYSVSSIKAGFLEDQARWIFLPASIEFQVSGNGQDFIKKLVHMPGNLDKNNEVKKVSASAIFSGEKIRYLRVIAKNNILPDWHPGAGKAAWLFADEIIIN